MDATRQIEAENSLINSFAKIRKITEKNELFKYYLHEKHKLFHDCKILKNKGF